MDCVVEVGIPPRRSSPHPLCSSPYSIGSSGGGVASYCGHSGSFAGAAVSLSGAVLEDFVKNPQQHSHAHAVHAASSAAYYAELDPSANLHAEGNQQQQKEAISNTQVSTFPSLSTCGGSASNLTTLVITTTATNASTSIAGSSVESTPLSGASSQQQLIRAKAERAVAESNQLRPPLKSRSSSHHRDNEEEGSHTATPPRPAQPETASSAAVAAVHCTSRSPASSKRPRQQQDQQPPIQGVDAPARAMHIPDLSTFADTSAVRSKASMTASNAISPVTVWSNGGAARVVHDTVDYEDQTNGVPHAKHPREGEEEGDVAKPKQQPRERRHAEYNAEQLNSCAPSAKLTSTTAAMKVIPTMTAGSNGTTHTVAPDATPQEPPPKKFAAGAEDAMEALNYTVARHEEDNEEAERRPASVRSRRRAAPSALEDDSNSGVEEEDKLASPSESSMPQSGERRLSTGSRRAAQARQQQYPKGKSDKENRRKSRLASTGSGIGSLLGGGRYHNDSITASIAYDPSRFSTPPLAQQQQSGESPVTQSNSSAGLKADMGRRWSESQPSCATPPEGQVHSKPAAAQQQVLQPPPAKPDIKLIETRYAFLAMSFMMRLLCKLHKGEPIPSSDFHSHCIPPMSVTMYVQRLVRYCACSGEALLCAFLLLLKYVIHSGHPITIYNAHRLLITSVVLGIKLRDDVYYSNVYYGRIGGISGREMNKLEVLFLSKLDWDTQVHAEEYTALLDLLEALSIDVDPTPEQLEAFAAAFPEKVAAYVPDEDDDEVEEAAAKLQQGSSPSPSTGATAAAAVNVKPGASAASALPDAQQRKLLRGAYRLHQWHTLVEPWMAQLQQHVFARKEENRQAAAAAWQAEGERWDQYYREDEEAAARQRRESSASAWLSPLSVQKRATSSATLVAASSGSASVSNAGGAATAAWSGEPPYQSAWSHAESISYHGGHASNSYSSQQQQQQHQEMNPRYSNFINFANVVTGGYFGSSAVSGSGGARQHSSPASSTQHQQQSSASAYHHRLSSSHRVSSAPMTAAGSNSVHYHTATERAPRPTSASFDITNRAAASSISGATAATTTTGYGTGSTPHDDDSSNHNHLNSNVEVSAPSLSQPSVAGMTATARTASPISSTTPGSGINVNAQPYYYVSSRVRKQQQQQQSVASASTSVGPELSLSSTDASPVRPGNEATVTDTTTSSSAARMAVPKAAPLAEGSVNPPSRLSSHPTTSTMPCRSGVEAVLAAMKRGSTSALCCPEGEKMVRYINSTEGSHNSGGGTASASHTFPARPIAKGMLGGHEGEQVASAHVPRRSPQSAFQPQAHRRSAYASQHSLGKKRSKPDSYKDY
ncbi:putative Cyc2-like cyclin [Leptomonas seymouri]|uniref:Putative Cyc2-like cyclin n=1 Tax=Leptomonas seymouri TaxID=5684 RepID=A0A0N1ILC7_LEPSE|nr:putative Cyc2-like cyclin [Leptomonas seymouri]|eukprot:KPI88040.1 putative Cyc2-like cyclin [Leptomonas seymouri]